ncbi:MAG: alpha-amylase family glycosyl hydrolase, partial [Prevotella sp.]
MKKLFTLVAVALSSLAVMAQGWPADYKGVMLQGFSWNSYVDTQWDNLRSQADELSQFFSLIWVPNSGNCNNGYNNMGYMPVYYYDQNSSFGTEKQLRSMISTFKEKGVGMIADVVVNHRNNIGENGSWVDYPVETYDGQEWTMYPSDICANDDKGKTGTWAKENGFTLSSNNDTGDDWDGCRDLDHKSENVQKNIINYLKFLKDDLGYIGYRYDMVKGYSSSFTGKYNSETAPKFSVGEYWDGNASVVKNWINGTKVNEEIQSAAFDFAFRYSVRDACNNGVWSNLAKETGITIDNREYARYAITFIENHDTQYRSASEPLDPIKKNIMAGNAYLLTSPGTPCVFLPHWKQYKSEIKQLIYIRQLAGISNTSKMYQMASNSAYYVTKTMGENNRFTMFIGGSNESYTVDAATLVASGDNYKVYLSNNTETAWVSVPSGEYPDEFEVTLTAVSASDGVKLVYTTDGSEPTVSSQTIDNGKNIKVSADMVLKVGLLVDGAVKGIITRSYTIKPFEPHTATVYVKDPQWTDMYFYAWANDEKSTQLLGDWPGIKQTEKKTIDGSDWYYHSFDINTSDYSFNIIFNQGMGKDQTVDIGPITSDKYYEIAEKSNGKYTVTDVTESMTSGISSIISDSNLGSAPVKVYTLTGLELRRFAAGTKTSDAVKGLPKGMYIVGNRKVA